MAYFSLINVESGFHCLRSFLFFSYSACKPAPWANVWRGTLQVLHPCLKCRKHLMPKMQACGHAWGACAHTTYNHSFEGCRPADTPSLSTFQTTFQAYLRNRMREYSSATRFWSGVPDSAQRYLQENSTHININGAYRYQRRTPISMFHGTHRNHGTHRYQCVSAKLN